MSLCYQGRGKLLLDLNLALVLVITLTLPKVLFCQDYFECLDMIVACICDRFNQPGYGVLKNLEDLLLKVTRNENYNSEIDFVLELYKKDFQPFSQPHSWNSVQQPLAHVRRNQHSWKHKTTSNLFHKPNEIACQKCAST